MAADPRPRLPARRAQDLPDDDRPQPDGPGLRRRTGGPNRLPEFAAGRRPSRPRPRRRTSSPPSTRMPLRRRASSPPTTRWSPRRCRASARSRCAQRAYDALLSDPAATALPDWIPANFAGPNGAKVFVRHSGKTLRVGIDGHLHLRRLPRRGARRGSRTSPPRRRSTARSSPAAARRAPRPRSRRSRRGHAEALLRRLHRPVGRLPARRDAGAAHRPPHRQREPQGPRQRRLGAEAAADRRRRRDRPRPPARRRRRRPPRPPTGVSKFLGKLGKLGKLAKTGAKFVPPRRRRPPLDTSGQAVSDHFKPLKGADRRGRRRSRRRSTPRWRR